MRPRRRMNHRSLPAPDTQAPRMRRAPVAAPDDQRDLCRPSVQPSPVSAVMVVTACAPCGTGRQNRSLRRGFARCCGSRFRDIRRQLFAAATTGLAAPAARCVFEIACGGAASSARAGSEPAANASHRGAFSHAPQWRPPGRAGCKEVNLRPAEPHARMRRATLADKAQNQESRVELVRWPHGRTRCSLFARQGSQP